MELTKQQHMNLFRAIINCYNVRASYGAGITMSIDRMFYDWFCVFDETSKLYTQQDIAPYWRKVVKGDWQCPLDNEFVQLVMKTIDWGRV